MATRRRVIVSPGADPAAFAVAAALVNRQCALSPPYEPVTVGSYKVDGEIIAYASPDSTWAVTKRLIDAATKTILVGTYDFTATYVADALAAAVGRGVKVELMLDLDGRSGELPVYDSLAVAGVKTHPAPACGKGHRNVFPSCHEKVTVIDGEWVLVQSGNYTENSIPANDPTPGSPANRVPGNRDMGLAIRSKSLARFFTKLLKADIKRAMDGFVPDGLVDLFDAEQVMFDTAPTALPPLRPERSFATAKSQRVQAAVTPDNFLAQAEAILRSATTSIDIEQQYIRPTQPAIVRLLQAIDETRAAHPGLKVRIILAPGHGGDDNAKLRRDLDTLADQHGLTFGSKVRLLNRKHFVHCHNKLIIADRKRVLVGSQNWSGTGVATNREAGIRVDHPGIAEYFSEFVDFDWTTGSKTKPKAPVADPNGLAPATIRVRAGDYEEV